MFLYNQSKLTNSAKKIYKRAALILSRCSLLLFREEFFILLLSIRRKTFPLHSFIFLILIIRWKTLDKRILTLSLIAFSLIAVITFLIFCVVLILFVMLLTPFLFYWEVVLTFSIRFSIVTPRRLLILTKLYHEFSRPFTYFIIESPVIAISFLRVFLPLISSWSDSSVYYHFAS